ncbi:polysaccharide deacetylase family protein [Sneathiella sp. HT1-7]|uniref:polysaccharide deacetylase family protein n=1 Tax=Sneathiella sp. HT1-7 TaxID=2887192 RepID=UPI001D150E0A|nr:polysaccharide deacetylase family protein [Sneathiella sp. HT1-7]MCC3306341.1 polysaccharide deacetylase family protein [Sneathiella sp. HT1-7]
MSNNINGWGPEGHRAALSITFDNLGAVAEEEIGLPIMKGKNGEHASIEVLPDLLGVLDGSKITYFIEGWNCQAHPDQILAVRDAGHEIAAHGWRHENWANTAVAKRKSALKKAVDAFAEIDVAVTGFRPPGGAIDLQELRAECLELGLNYASPLGDVGDDSIDGDFVSLPFAWKHVDAYMLNPDLGALRQKFGDPEKPVSLDQWGDVIDEMVEKVKSERSHATIIFHPFMLGKEKKAFDIFERLVKSVRKDDDIWAPTCSELVTWLENRKEA